MSSICQCIVARQHLNGDRMTASEMYGDAMSEHMLHLFTYMNTLASQYGVNRIEPDNVLMQSEPYHCGGKLLQTPGCVVQTLAETHTLTW